MGRSEMRRNYGHLDDRGRQNGRIMLISLITAIAGAIAAGFRKFRGKKNSPPVDPVTAEEPNIDAVKKWSASIGRESDGQTRAQPVSPGAYPPVPNHPRDPRSGQRPIHP
jgi:hypothetical protein